MQKPLLIDENPIRAVGQLLSLALLAAVAMQETIKLMEVPLSSWKDRQLSMEHAKQVEEDVTVLLRDHQDISARLKVIGY